MSSHRAGRRAAVESRAAGHRRVAGATAVSAVSGTALAVLFATLFAQPTTTPVVAAAEAVPVEAAAISVTEPAQQASGAVAHAGSTAKHPRTPSTTQQQQKVAPQPPASAPQSTHGKPAASSGGS